MGKKRLDAKNGHKNGNGSEGANSSTAPLTSSDDVVRSTWRDLRDADDQKQTLYWARSRCGPGGSGLGDANDVRFEVWSWFMREEEEERQKLLKSAASGGDVNPDGSSKDEAVIRQEQVLKVDIERSLFHIAEARREEQRVVLSGVIKDVLLLNPHLHYYQGLHEVCSVPLLVSNVDRQKASQLSFALMTRYFATCCSPSFHETEKLLQAVFKVVQKDDPQFANALIRCGVAPAFHFCLAWVITWFSHHTTNFTVLLRVFDYLIAARDPLRILFLSAALIRTQRDHPAFANPSMDFFAEAHTMMTSMPTVLDSMSGDELEKLLAEADQLAANHHDIAASTAATGLDMEEEVANAGLEGDDAAATVANGSFSYNPETSLDDADAAEKQPSRLVRGLEIAVKLIIVGCVVGLNVWSPYQSLSAS